MYDLVRNRHGKKFYVKVVKVSKDYSWRDVLASMALKVTFNNINKIYENHKF